VVKKKLKKKACISHSRPLRVITHSSYNELKLKKRALEDLDLDIQFRLHLQYSFWIKIEDKILNREACGLA